MTHTDPPRLPAARLRTLCLQLATLIAAMAALATVPTAALAHERSAHRRPGTHRRTRPHASVRAHHRPTCRGAHDLISRTPARDIQRATLCLLNVQRHRHGLPRLRDNRHLNRSAQSWTNTMVSHRLFSHSAAFGERILHSGFDWSRVGENIADGYRTPAGAVVAWMRSLGHCQNILTPDFREEGAGFDSGTALGDVPHGTWTLDLGLGMHQHAWSDDWAPAEGCPYRD